MIQRIRHIIVNAEKVEPISGVLTDFDGDCPVRVDPAKAASLTSIEEEVDLAWLGLASLAWTAA